MTEPEKIVNKCLEKAGTDFTPDWMVPDEVSCSYAVTTILKEIDPLFPIITGTYTLDDYLSKNPKFERVLEPEAGDLVVSPTGQGNGNLIGHTGFYINETDIMSNNSNTGLFEKNYTRESWRNRYHYKGGFPVRLYRKIA